VFLLFACHLSNTTEPQETFTFPTLKDSIGTADSVLIVLKDQGGRVIDTLFNGKVSGATQFKDLKAPHYDGGRVQIYVEASQNGKPIYKVERGFDPAQGGNIEGTKKIYLTPSLAIQLEKVLTKVREGEAVPMPGYSVIPPTLDDKTVLWVSRSSAVLKVEGNTLLGVAPGFTHLIASLAADTSKKDSLTIEVVSKTAPTKPIDSLILNTDTLVLALGGPSGRFTLRSIPTSASTEATWSLLSGTSIQLATDGLISPVAEGLSRVSAVSKLDITVADTAWVKVLPKQKVDSIRFVLRSLDLFAGGTAESLLVKAYPALAPQGVQLSVQDTALAHLSGTTIQGGSHQKGFHPGLGIPRGKGRQRPPQGRQPGPLCEGREQGFDPRYLSRDPAETLLLAEQPC
jgi:hypothetical protein